MCVLYSTDSKSILSQHVCVCAVYHANGTELERKRERKVNEKHRFCWMVLFEIKTSVLNMCVYSTHTYACHVHTRMPSRKSFNFQYCDEYEWQRFCCPCSPAITAWEKCSTMLPITHTHTNSHTKLILIININCEPLAT